MAVGESTRRIEVGDDDTEARKEIDQDILVRLVLISRVLNMVLALSHRRRC